MRKGVLVTKIDKAKNTGQITKGNAKEVAGKTAGDKNLEAEGKADQMKGNVKQAGEKVKDAFNE
jgi:uncharacterized protein YjbJ (UPF0337 family)